MLQYKATCSDNLGIYVVKHYLIIKEYIASGYLVVQRKVYFDKIDMFVMKYFKIRTTI